MSENKHTEMVIIHIDYLRCDPQKCWEGVVTETGNEKKPVTEVIKPVTTVGNGFSSRGQQ